MAEKIIQLALNSKLHSSKTPKNDNKARYSYYVTDGVGQNWVGMMSFSSSDFNSLDWSTVTKISLTLTANNGGDYASQQVKFYTSKRNSPADTYTGTDYIGEYLGSFNKSFRLNTTTIEFKDEVLSRLKTAFANGKRMIIIADDVNTTTNRNYCVFTDAKMTVTYDSSGGDSNEPTLTWNSNLTFNDLENNQVKISWRPASFSIDGADIKYDIWVNSTNLGPRSTTSCTIDVEPNVSQTYKVTAYVIYNGQTFSKTITASYTYTGTGGGGTGDGGNDDEEDYWEPEEGEEYEGFRWDTTTLPILTFSKYSDTRLKISWPKVIAPNKEVIFKIYDVTEEGNPLQRGQTTSQTANIIPTEYNRARAYQVIAQNANDESDYIRSEIGYYTHYGSNSEYGEFKWDGEVFVEPRGSKIFFHWNQPSSGFQDEDFRILAKDPKTDEDFQIIFTQDGIPDYMRGDDGSQGGKWANYSGYIEPYKYNTPCLYMVQAYFNNNGINDDLVEAQVDSQIYEITINYNFPNTNNSWYWPTTAPSTVPYQGNSSTVASWDIFWEDIRDSNNQIIHPEDAVFKIYYIRENEEIKNEITTCKNDTRAHIRSFQNVYFQIELTYDNQVLYSDLTPIHSPSSVTTWAGNAPFVKGLDSKTLELSYTPLFTGGGFMGCSYETPTFKICYDCPSKNITKELLKENGQSHNATISCPQVNEECYYYIVLEQTTRKGTTEYFGNKTPFTLLSSDEPETPPETPDPEPDIPPENTKRQHTINCRLISRHDTEKNWLTKNPSFIPYQGEIIVFDTDNSYSYERFKIGDGVKNVFELPFANSLSQSEIDSAIQDSLKDGNYSINADTLGGISSSEYALTEKVVTSVNGQVGDILLIDGNLVSIPEAEETLEEGQYIVNAEQLGGIDSSRYALTENIVTSINGQVGDVTIEKEDLSDFYSSENQPPYPVISVNGQTGEVVIEQPDLVRIEDVTVDLEEGIYLANADQLGGKNAAEYALIDNVVTSINGQTGNVTLEEPDLSGFYSETNPPQYPVTSVNGMSGDVTITIEQPDLVRIEDAEVDAEEGIYLTNAEQLGGRNAAAYALKEEVVTSINGQSGNVVLEERDLSNYYSTEHQPPYPVTSVNGSTGDIIIPDNVIIPDSEIDLEEGIYLTNAETLGGKLASEYATKEDVYIAIQEALGSIPIAEGVGF